MSGMIHQHCIKCGAPKHPSEFNATAKGPMCTVCYHKYVADLYEKQKRHEGKVGK